MLRAYRVVMATLQGKTFELAEEEERKKLDFSNLSLFGEAT